MKGIARDVAIFFALCFFVQLAVEAGNQGRFVFKNRKSAPEGWQVFGKVASLEQDHTFHIALVQRNLDQLEKKFWAVSDPDSDDYGNFLTPEEILDIIKPSPKAVRDVTLWLKKYGVKNIQNLGDALKVVASVETTQALFQTTFQTFKHAKSGRKLVRSLGEYSIPTYLKEHIYMVTGVSDFVPQRARSTIKKNIKDDDHGVIIPPTLWSTYQIPPTLTIVKNVSQGPIEFQDDQSIDMDDVSSFDDQTGTARQPAPTIVGPFSGEDGEATLDYEYITAVGKNARNFYWTEPNWLYDFAVSFFKATDIPSVISLSWGWSEADQCSIETECDHLGVNSQQYVERVNTEFQKIGLRGVTILVASGDSGANGRTDEDCEEKQLLPDYPAASPYITSVGATQFAKGSPTSTTLAPVCKDYTCAVNGVEEAVSYDVANFASGGGFSNVAAQPSYQKSAVSNYLKVAKGLPPKSYFNITGRGYPDIAALGDNVVIVMGGDVQLTGGTSASAPIVAGVISLLNDYRAQRNLSPIGFFNPLLYKIASSNPKAFHDVTVGDNKCTESGCSDSCKGFTAAKGWDPVTGWGTPNFTELLKQITLMDNARLRKLGKSVVEAN